MNRCSLLNPWNMIHLKTIVNHCTRKGYIPLRNGRKKKLQKQSILICVKFFLALYMTYLFYCINRFRLEWPLRKGMVMGVSMCKMLHLFSLKVVAFTLNYIGKLFGVLWPKRKTRPSHKGAVFTENHHFFSGIWRVLANFTE
jgi:cbb3-type cytochrome oxidase subunit 3